MWKCFQLHLCKAVSTHADTGSQQHVGLTTFEIVCKIILKFNVGDGSGCAGVCEKRLKEYYGKTVYFKY